MKYAFADIGGNAKSKDDWCALLDRALIQHTDADWQQKVRENAKALRALV